MKKPINNDELKKFIRKSKAQFDRAKTIEDIKNNFQEIKEFPYQFKNGVVRYIISILITIPLWIYVFYCFPRPTGNGNYEYLLANYPNWLEDWLEAHPFLPAEFITEFITKFVSFHEGEYVEFTIAMLIFFLFPFSIISISYLVEGLVIVKKYQTYISGKTVQLIYDSKRCERKFIDQEFAFFYDLSRGNHKNNIEDCVNLEFNSVVGEQRVRVFTYHYVDIEQDEDGSLDRDYYRHCVFFPSIGKVHSLLISRSSKIDFEPHATRKLYPKTFMPASLKFKKLFKTVRANEELNLAKFLEPDVVVMLEKAGSRIKGLTVEFNKNGDMVISKNAVNLFDVKTKNNLENPDLLFEELTSGISFPNLDYVLGFANNLIKQFK